ncbi:hypothetical protein [Kribbella deserti]|uniref:Uncharacterized protein n=1 Tax=Kribbella deserti TaxID=1926257 RepID=A0ABV6QXL4_9ACTN
MTASLVAVAGLMAPIGINLMSGAVKDGTGRSAQRDTAVQVVTPQVVLDTISTTNADNGQLTVTGHVTPALPDYTWAYLQRYDTDAKLWVNVAKRQMVAGKIGITATRPGSVAHYRLTTPATDGYAEGASAAKSFTHYVWRGAFTKAYGFHSDGSKPWALTPESANYLWVNHDVRGETSPVGVVAPPISGCLEVRAWLANRYANYHADFDLKASLNASHDLLGTASLGGTAGTSVKLEAPLTISSGAPYQSLYIQVRPKTPYIGTTPISNWNLEVHLRCAN